MGGAGEEVQAAVAAEDVVALLDDGGHGREDEYVVIALAVGERHQAADRIVAGGVDVYKRQLLCTMTLLVSWGAVLDIREAFSARELASDADMLQDAYAQLEDLNGTLRAQRHDFMNHLQVVFSLLELEDYKEASDYIERVYGDIRRVSRTLKMCIRDRPQPEHRRRAGLHERSVRYAGRG